MKLPQTLIEYEPFKRRSRRMLLGMSIILTLLLAWLRPHWAMPFALGTMLGYAYFLSLFLTVDYPQSKLAAGIFVLRIAIVSFLIVFLGQLTLWKIGLVFVGFLSYKVVLFVEIIRAGIGFNRSRGK